MSFEGESATVDPGSYRKKVFAARIKAHEIDRQAKQRRGSTKPKRLSKAERKRRR